MTENTEMRLFDAPYDDERQFAVDAFYHEHGPCCAGCDHWRFINSSVGECRKSAPVSAQERWAMVGIHSSLDAGAGHVMTPRHHHCGDFADTYAWPNDRTFRDENSK
jgi:hypothetical protein